ncbi:MAG: insulinase family protein [Myxococcales bacterium]|nr:MAG: insulinase family protein [Myxococcales bacterium]
MTLATRLGVYAVLMSYALCALHDSKPAYARDAKANATPQTETELESRAPELRVERYRLPNGLTALLSSDHSLPWVGVSVCYAVGALDDPAARPGLAHLFEHLMFGGSRNVGSRFASLLDAAGATDVNAVTGWDSTCYFETLPSEAWPLALWIESDRLGFLELPSRERLSKQLQVIEQEWLSRVEADAYARSDLALRAALFARRDRRASSILGSLPELKGVDDGELRRFKQCFYRPQNATLALVGDFDIPTARNLVERYFASLPSSSCKEALRAHESPSIAPKPTHVHVVEPVSVERVALGWVAPSAYSSDGAALRLALLVLGAGEGSRLRQYLVHRAKLATDVRVSFDTDRSGGVVSLAALVASGQEARTVQFALEREVELLGLEGPFEVELQRARRQLIRSAASDLERLVGDEAEGSSGRADTLQRLERQLGRADELRSWLHRCEAVTVADVQRVVTRYLKVARASVVVTSPEPSHAL